MVRAQERSGSAALCARVAAVPPFNGPEQPLSCRTAITKRTNHIGPQTGVAADSELRLHNSNVASVIKGYSWPSGTSSGEIWVSYSGINGMLLRGQQKIRFDIAGLEQCSVGPGGFDTASNTKVYKVNGVQVAGPRKTGWATATGNATRSTFDTSSVTLTQLAERVKALIDDLHGAAGHGLIGT
ncbi:MAG TPA: hypothetical protein VFT40_04790 [Sphingomicrobium sp.]|nr:hypothetical protein [Sphingomicrobium sp.]